MKCTKCGVTLASYGNYRELKICADCGRRYVILQGKPKLISKSTFRKIKTIIDKSKNREESKEVFIL
ncbi:hypothetical protein RBU49_06795 [Clostridium sp. MB40-C1]|uniref:hypothetical protein n=1 Tax=Clostridium sp. MB40-C1 TaxID=3070996 RepID=UPI0027DEF827|nr:hypothetical protein [Clostridium sp. MB40-C1]WMJ81950.1 hypothetical protein RBU49_06795 [Clostridium sp. MB40-C1]